VTVLLSIHGKFPSDWYEVAADVNSFSPGDKIWEIIKVKVHEGQVEGYRKREEWVYYKVRG
jgi:hypothetical protein